MISTVLIVDDSRSSRNVNLRFATELLGPGVRFLEACDGAAALEILAREPIELMLLDLTMPGMSGFEVLAELRRRELQLMVIVLSGDVQRLTRERVMQLGAAGFIEKPIKFEAMKAMLAALGVDHE
jgi:two-component system chemotaxis response regulator CheY